MVLISFALYLIAMIIIGLYFYNRTSNFSEYILGDRKLNAWVVSLSAQASDMSGWLLMGLPGYAYLAGLESFWLLIGLLIGTYFNWKYISPRLRSFTEFANNSLTLPDYFTNRLKAKGIRLRVISSLFILFFFLIYTSSGFVAGAKLFSSLLEIDYQVALIIGASVIVSYTFLGGFLAVSWTDVIQGTIMFFAVIIVPIYAIVENGGFVFTLNEIVIQNENYFNVFTNSDGEIIPIITIISLLAWGLGYMGQPHILARFMSIKDVGELSKARKIAMYWVTFSLIFAVIIGMIGFAIFPESLVGTDSEKIFILLVQNFMHPLLGGIFLAAILAAVMSTADSQLLVASSSLAEDFYKQIIKKDASDKELLLIGRISVILISIIAIIIGLNPKSSVLNLVAYAWAGFGATFGPIVLLSLYWKSLTERGAFYGIITGGLVTIIWKNLSGGIFDLYEILPGFIAALLTSIFISKLGNNDNLEDEIKLIFHKSKIK